jgi:hypothetical protein
MLTLKQKVKCHFMKRGEYVLEGDKDQNIPLLLFSISKWFSFLVSIMSVEESLVGKL